MIRVEFSLSTTSKSGYSVDVKSLFVPEGETSYSEQALHLIESYLKDVILDLPDNLGTENVFQFYLSYHENAVLTSKISEKMPEEMYLSQNDLAKRIHEGEKGLEQGNSQKENVGYRYPILHVSAANMLSGDKRIIHNIRYYNIMDSSIWNYYISFQELYCVEGLEHLRYIFEQMIRNQIGQLYDLRISTEYADLNARLVQGDYTDPIGHGSSVTPFLFHSEWKMKGMCKDLLTDEIVKQKWRFLLLDDCVMDSLRLHSEEGPKFNPELGKVISSSKLAIVKRAIEDIPGMSVSWYYYDNGSIVARSNDDLEDDIRVQVWCVKTIDEALTLLKCYKFDVILLDYLLGSHSLTEDSIRRYATEQGLGVESLEKMVESWKKDTNSSSREYGYQLLKYLKLILESSDTSPFSGPSECQFFMFISAFTTAVYERLRAEGLNRSEKYWYIAEGACPTNTPELFRYYLMRVMDRRLEQTGIKDLSESHIMETALKIYDVSADTATGLISSVRRNAYKEYHKILGLHYDYRVLKNDQGKSRLIDSFVENKVHMGAMLEHLLQLVHLTAFGTVRQWPEIWEEYKFFVRTLNVDKESIREFSKHIEDYLIVLKSA